NDHAIGAVQNLLHFRDYVPNALLAVMTQNKVVNHASIDWPRPVKCVKRRKILDATRLQLSANLLHPRRLKLKNRICSPFAKQLHSPFVIKQYLRPVDVYAKRVLYAL